MNVDGAVVSDGEVIGEIGQGLLILLAIARDDTENDANYLVEKIAALRIFDGLENGEDEIFPDPASRSIAEDWRTGALKALERQFSAFVPTSPAIAA